MEDVTIKSEVDADADAAAKTQAELDNELFSKMKAAERKRKPPPVVKKEEDEGEPCKILFSAMLNEKFSKATTIGIN